MFDWIRRIVYIADVGRMHARRNYPGEEDFIEVPLYGAGDGRAAAAEAERPQAAPAAPANDPHDLPREAEA